MKTTKGRYRYRNCRKEGHITLKAVKIIHFFDLQGAQISVVRFSQSSPLDDFFFKKKGKCGPKFCDKHSCGRKFFRLNTFYSEKRRKIIFKARVTILNFLRGGFNK